MSFKCKIGLHSWGGCRCTTCKKKRDKKHVWAGCFCLKCGRIRDEQHDWTKYCETCSKCGKIRENQHDWSKDCEKCSVCSKIEDHHNWSKDCNKCSKCNQTRNEKHDFKEGICEKCKIVDEELRAKYLAKLKADEDLNLEIGNILRPAIEKNREWPPNKVLNCRSCLEVARRLDFTSPFKGWNRYNQEELYKLMADIPETSLVALDNCDRLLLLRTSVWGRLFAVSMGEAASVWFHLNPSDSEKADILSDDHIDSFARIHFEELYNLLLKLEEKYRKNPSSHNITKNILFAVHHVCFWNFDRAIKLRNFLAEFENRCNAAAGKQIDRRLIEGWIPTIFSLYIEGRDYNVDYQPCTAQLLWHNESNSDDDVWTGEMERLSVRPI